MWMIEFSKNRQKFKTRYAAENNEKKPRIDVQILAKIVVQIACQIAAKKNGPW